MAQAKNGDLIVIFFETMIFGVRDIFGETLMKRLSHVPSVRAKCTRVVATKKIVGWVLSHISILL